MAEDKKAKEEALKQELEGLSPTLRAAVLRREALLGMNEKELRDEKKLRSLCGMYGDVKGTRMFKAAASKKSRF